jgi:alpha-glucoside transport system ATP-binding protein
MNLIAGEVTGTGTQTTVRLGSGQTVTSAIATQEADKGRAVNVGVRPEDMVIAAEGAPAVYEGKVDYVERLGEVTVLYFETEGDSAPVIAKLPGIHKGLRGTTVRLDADPAKVHLFANGRSLREA